MKAIKNFRHIFNVNIYVLEGMDNNDTESRRRKSRCDEATERNDFNPVS